MSLVTFKGIDFSTRNIEQCWDLKTEKEKELGHYWYSEARDICREIAQLESVWAGSTIESVAGILAALSPCLPWEDNVVACREVLVAGISHRQSRVNNEKARRIKNGEEPLDVLGGLKVRAFYRNIIGDRDVVTIDRHAYSVAAGRHLKDSEAGPLPAKAYYAVESLYKEAARELEVCPVELQSTTWLTWRRLKKEGLVKK